MKLTKTNGSWIDVDPGSTIFLSTPPTMENQNGRWEIREPGTLIRYLAEKAGWTVHAPRAIMALASVGTGISSRRKRKQA